MHQQTAKYGNLGSNFTVIIKCAIIKPELGTILKKVPCLLFENVSGFE